MTTDTATEPTAPPADTPTEDAADEKGTRKPLPKQAPKSRGRGTPVPKKIDFDGALEVLSAALTDPDNEAHEAAVDYVEAHFKRLAEAAGPAPEVGHPTVYRAILAVMRDVRAVGKNGVNEDQHYKFRGIDDVVNALGPAMRTHGLLMFPKLVRKDVEKFERANSNGRRSFSTSVQVEVGYKFVNAFGEPGDEVEITVPGESIDTSDKATAKAMSVALRIGLLQTFALPTYDEDPDQRNPEVETPAPIEADELRQSCAHANTYPDLAQGFRELRGHYGPRLAVTEVVTKDGEKITGDEYVSRAEALYAEQRAQAEAERERARQDQDAQGPTTDARTDDAAPAQERAQEQQPPAQDPAQEAAQPEQPRATGVARMLELARDEAKFHAETLRRNAKDYAAPMLDSEGYMIEAKVKPFLVGNRPQVIAALRSQGEATVADNLERLGDAFPLLLETLYETPEGANA